MIGTHIAQVHIFFRIIIPTHIAAFIYNFCLLYYNTIASTYNEHTVAAVFITHYYKLSACGCTLRSSNEAITSFATKVHSYAKVALTKVFVNKAAIERSNSYCGDVLRCCCVYLLRSAINSNNN